MFFEQDEDALPEPDEAVGLLSLTNALSEADKMIETSSADLHEKAETVLGACTLQIPFPSDDQP